MYSNIGRYEMSNTAIKEIHTIISRDIDVKFIVIYTKNTFVYI